MNDRKTRSILTRILQGASDRQLDSNYVWFTRQGILVYKYGNLLPVDTVWISIISFQNLKRISGFFFARSDAKSVIDI
jgi:hypothetical protein